LFVLLTTLAVFAAACGSTDDVDATGAAPPTATTVPTTVADTQASNEPTNTEPSAPDSAVPSVNEASEPAAGESATNDTEGSPAATEESSYPVTIAADNGEVTIDQQPQRIVSLSPTATEMLFAIGAGDQVVAVDEYSNYPAEAPTTDLSGFQPNVEAILAEEPGLVVAASDPGDLVTGLDAAGVPVLIYDAATDLDDSYAQIEQLGAATGHLGDAAEVVGQMQTDIDALVSELPTLKRPLTYYHELDPSLFSVTGDTFIGEVYSLLGLESVADAAEDAGGYPQLNAEFVAESDPDFVFLADTLCCEVDAEEFASRPGFEGLAAVQRDAVVGLDDDVASRWGPRIVEFIEVVADAVTENMPEGASTQ
jgi:iron complex transport system substrate-binding protein